MDVPIAPDEPPPDMAGMEARVAALETDMKDVKAGQHRLELAAARIEAGLAGLATRADMAAVSERLTGVSERLVSVEARVGKAEKAIEGAMAAAIAKSIGPWQLPAVLGASAGVLGAVVLAVGWLISRPWFPH